MHSSLNGITPMVQLHLSRAINFKVVTLVPRCIYLPKLNFLYLIIIQLYIYPPRGYSN